MNDPRSAPRWMSWTLRLAAVYNIVWGAWVVLLPMQFFQLAGMPEPAYPSIWQCVGMIVGVYGIGYAIAASDPYRHWPIILVGFLGKILGPIGYVQGAFISRTLDPAFGLTIPTNDLIWWVPFAAILYGAFKHHAAPRETSRRELFSLLDETPTSSGRTVGELARQAPTLVVLLRHQGCTFCREAVSDLAKHRQTIESRGRQILVVTQSAASDAERFLQRYGLDDLPYVSDPDATLYRAFDLTRGSAMQLFGPRVWLRGIVAGVLRRHGLGKLDGDGFQMPGAFLIHRGRVIARHEYADAADRADFVDLACNRPVEPSP